MELRTGFAQIVIRNLDKMVKGTYTTIEIDFLKKNYGKIKTREIALKLNRKLKSIQDKTNLLGLRNHSRGIVNGMWAGENVKYGAIHDWIKRRKPKPKKCPICKERKPYDLANISGEYKRDINDFEWLCRSCHMTFDHKKGIRKGNCIRKIEGDYLSCFKCKQMKHKSKYWREKERRGGCKSICIDCYNLYYREIRNIKMREFGKKYRKTKKYKENYALNREKNLEQMREYYKKRKELV